MNCREVQEQILESLSEPQPGGNSAVLEHLSGCADCRRFFQTQRDLDVQLSRAISAPPLSPRFHQSVMEKVRREPYSVWTESLPDKAHLAGCLCAMVLSIWILPLSPNSVLLTGMVFTLVTYFVHAVVGSALESWEEGQQ